MQAAVKHTRTHTFILTAVLLSSGCEPSFRSKPAQQPQKLPAPSPHALAAAALPEPEKEKEKEKKEIVSQSRKVAVGSPVRKMIWPFIKVLEEDIRGCAWVERQGAAQQEADESVYQMRAEAIARARAEAIEGFLHLPAFSHAMTYRDEFLNGRKDAVSELLELTTPARMLDEQIRQEGYQQIADCPDCLYRVNFEACVAHLARRPDHEFYVRLKLGRSHLSVGQNLDISVTTNRNIYLYAYVVDADWTTKLLVPNGNSDFARLKAAKTWHYSYHLDPADQSSSGYKIKAIRVVASRTQLSHELDDPAFGGYLSLARRLNGSSLDWREDAEAFAVSRP
jgi:hypothetical protein